MQDCFCKGCTKPCAMKIERIRKMEKFKRTMIYLGTLLLPPIMLVIMMILMTLCIGAMFDGMIKNDENVAHGIQVLNKAGEKTWKNFEKWANE